MTLDQVINKRRSIRKYKILVLIKKLLKQLFKPE